MATIKKTVTVQDLGKSIDPSKGHGYRVTKTQNTLEPRIRQILHDDEVQALINQGITVNVENHG